MVAAIVAQSAVMEEIKQWQLKNEFLQKICDELETKPRPEFIIENSVLKFQGRWCVHNVPTIKKRIMEKAHSSKYAMYPSSTKMYHNLKHNFLWPGMKREIVEFISKCLQCQQVKVEHQRPTGLHQALPIPKWKWEHLTMDFIMGLPRTPRGINSIWVIVDRLTKSTHFLPVKTQYNADKLATI
mgnify:CR=1 FL=1